MPVPDLPYWQMVRKSICAEPEDAWDPHDRRQCDSRWAYGTAWCAAAAALSQTDRAPRGVSIVTTGKISGLPCTTRTWLIVSLLKSLLFRQASRLRSLSRGHSVRFWCAQGGMKPCKTSASVADGHQRAAKCLSHGPGGSLSSPLSERDHTICLYRVRTVLRKKVNRSIVLTIDLLTRGARH